VKEPPISTVIQTPARLGGVSRRPERPTGLVPNWLKTIPFVALHLAVLSVLFLPDYGVSLATISLCAFTYFIRMFGITGVYHRYFAHRSYKTSRVMQFCLAWLGCSAMQKGPLWWASHHRQHHRYSDTPDDPHSPHVTSFWWAHLGWILSEDHVETPWESIKDWSRYPELRLMDQLHVVPGLVLGVLCYLVAGWAGVAWGFVVSTILCYHATFSINSLSHLIGKRRYATGDESRNNLFLALITLGEGWHNNHHHYQSSANQGFFWWEIDISYYVIRTLGLLGLVWDVRKPGAKALAFRNVELAHKAAG
jgi:stearoyl-CoA desaturase (delta-9 desaturase)